MHKDDRIAAGFEYVARYNMWQDVPYVPTRIWREVISRNRVGRTRRGPPMLAAYHKLL